MVLIGSVYRLRCVIFNAAVDLGQKSNSAITISGKLKCCMAKPRQHFPKCLFEMPRFLENRNFRIRICTSIFDIKQAPGCLIKKLDLDRSLALRYPAPAQLIFRTCKTVVPALVFNKENAAFCLPKNVLRWGRSYYPCDCCSFTSKFPCCFARSCVNNTHAGPRISIKTSFQAPYHCTTINRY